MKCFLHITVLLLSICIHLEMAAQWCATRSDPALFDPPNRSTHTDLIQPRSVLTLPVVVHIVWNTDAQNISDDQIRSQMEALNRAYRGQNDNQDIIPLSLRGLFADMELEFCLAERDPDGALTNGITRTNTRQDKIGSLINQGRRAICYSDLGGKDAWDTERYINIWVGEMAAGIAGEASFPGMDIPEEDGIRITPDRFGTMGTVSAPYDLGNTLVHELGHYLNLQHLWGSCTEGQICCSNIDPDCACDDGVDDTPAQFTTYLSACPAGNQITCGGPDMFMNYMTFADDACMAMFSEGQKRRVMATLDGPRRGLTASMGCLPGTVTAHDDVYQPDDLFAFGPNPASERLFLTTETNSPRHVYLLGIDGKIKLQTFITDQNTEISIASLPAGIYWIKMMEGEKNSLKKLIIAR